MAQFYKELKKLRTSRGISLEEISDRTKINIKYIKAIEAGDFINIETVIKTSLMVPATREGFTF